MSQQRNLCTDCKSTQQLQNYMAPYVVIKSEGTPYHSPKLHPGPSSSVGMQRHIDSQTSVANIHFATSMTRTKCNSQSHNNGTVMGKNNAKNYATFFVFLLVAEHSSLRSQFLNPESKVQQIHTNHYSYL